jgi:hypothetical protein
MRHLRWFAAVGERAGELEAVEAAQAHERPGW